MNGYGSREQHGPFEYVPSADQLQQRREAIAAHIEQTLPTFWEAQQPRDYQVELTERFAEVYIERARQGEAPLQGACIQFPGAGKTVEAAYIAKLMGVGKQLIDDQPPIRGLYVAPNLHILAQAEGSTTAEAKGFTLIAPGIPLEMYHRGLGPKRGPMQMITSLMLVMRDQHNLRRARFNFADIAFFDEADLFLGKAARAAVEQMQHNGTTTIGMSATASVHRQRNKSKHIGDIWPETLDTRSLGQGIKDGYLRPPIIYGAAIDMQAAPDVSGLSKRQGRAVLREYVKRESGIIAERAALILASFGLKTMIFNNQGEASKRARDLAHTLQHVQVMDRGSDITYSRDAEAIGSFRTDSQRAIHRLESGEAQYLTSVKMGERGTDIKGLRGLVLTSCSISEARVTQQLGRVLRLSEAERLGDEPPEPAIIVYIDYSNIPTTLHMNAQVTPFDILDIPTNASIKRKPNRPNPFPHRAAPYMPELDDAMLSVGARRNQWRIHKRGSYFIRNMIGEHENDLAEVAAWTGSEAANLRRALRTNGYPVRTIAHGTHRVEVCSDNALLFLEVAMAQPGEKHAGQIARDVRLPRDIVLRGIRKLGLVDDTRPKFSRAEPVSGFVPTPEHFSAEVTKVVEQHVGYSEEAFDSRSDIGVVEFALKCKISKASLVMLCTLAGIEPYKRIRGMAKTDCISSSHAREIEDALDNMQPFPRDTELMNHRTYLTRLGNRDINKDSAAIADTLHRQGFRPTIYRTGNNAVSYGLTPEMVTFLDQAYEVPMHPTRQLRHIAPPTAPEAPVPQSVAAPAVPQQAEVHGTGRHTFYRPEDIQRAQINGVKLRPFAKAHQTLIETLLAVLSHIPEVTQANIGRNKEGDIVIDHIALQYLNDIVASGNLPRVPFGWQSLNRIAEENGVALAKLMGLLRKSSWAQQQVRSYQITETTQMHFGSPIVAARLEDMFERINSQRRG